MSTETNLRFEELESVESTQDFVFEHLAPSAGKTREWLLVIADRQSRGRGTRSREWAQAGGPEDRLILSLGTAFKIPKEPWPIQGISLVAGECLWNALETAGIAMEKLFLKWPNDLMVDSGKGPWKKAGGILCEYKKDRLVIGIGLNLKTAPPEINTATSLQHFLPLKVPSDFRSRLARFFYQEFQAAFESWSQDPALYMKKLSDRLNAGSMKPLRDSPVEWKPEGRKGQVWGVDAEGLLCIRLADPDSREIHVRSSDEVSFFQFLSA
jgi:biotin-[acetyl-CoA-carboxylase] ligase BirA-like protein